MAIRYWSRRNSCFETEKVYGDSMVNFLYGNPLGFALADSILVRKPLSQAYGALQDTVWSARKIPGFIEKFQIPMQDYEGDSFHSFNEFFIRKFKPGKRSFPSDPKTMGAFAEARYLAFENADANLEIPVKGLRLTAASMLQNLKEKELFQGGPCLLARLCPVDYHRYHFPDSGIVLSRHMEHGKLHSVNPLALHKKPDLFLSNERQVTLLETKHFGKLAYVEVGALCVGKIVETHPSGKPFERGAEKGYFLFGGSTVILYGERGAWHPSEDLLANTQKGFETLVELGSPVAKA